ncbi:MAG: excinuclease ABC subunit UvrC, partial [Granulosicoccaceae bacterium]
MSDETSAESASGSDPAAAGIFDPKSFLRTVTTRPGVYRMKNAEGEIIYVGKASNLRNRLSSYFQKNVDSRKTRNLVSHIAEVETTVTRSETEALILENQLIKAHMPRYNILLRDDKSYPYVFMSTQQEYPRLAYHRGARKQKGAYFGPYPNGFAVRKTLNFVQKLFQVRQCEDSYFRNRSRPCLQYQIKRCSGPCVGIVSTEEYAHDVEMTRRVLSGENKEVIADLIAQMQTAAADQAYERAALLRDRIADLKHLTDQQFVAGTGGQADIVACAVSGGQSCVQVFYVRNGLNLGNTAFYPTMPADMPPEEVLYSFVTQYYFGQELPQRIILSHPVEDQDLLAQAFSERAGRKVVLSHNVRGERARW